MKKIFALAVLALALSGCATGTPGTLTKTGNVIDMEPGWLSSGLKEAKMKLGARWTPSMGDEFDLSIYWPGGLAAKSVTVEIDGEKQEMEIKRVANWSKDAHIGGGHGMNYYYMPEVNFAGGCFRVPLDYARKLTNSKVKFYVTGRDEVSYSGNLSSGPTLANGGLVKFIAAVDKARQ